MTNPFQVITDRLDAIQNKVGEIDYFLQSTKQPSQELETYMTRQEVADLFKISLPTVHAWMNTGILKYYKIANKTRFLRGEVLAAITAIKQKGGSHE